MVTMCLANLQFSFEILQGGHGGGWGGGDGDLFTPPSILLWDPPGHQVLKTKNSPGPSLGPFPSILLWDPLVSGTFRTPPPGEDVPFNSLLRSSAVCRVAFSNWLSCWPSILLWDLLDYRPHPHQGSTSPGLQFSFEIFARYLVARCWKALDCTFNSPLRSSVAGNCLYTNQQNCSFNSPLRSSGSCVF